MTIKYRIKDLLKDERPMNINFYFFFKNDIIKIN